MPNRSVPRRVIRFGEFEVDFQAGQLLKRGVKIRLREQSFQVLAALLEHAGEVVTREQLQQRLWPGESLVDVEINLNTAIARLREALGDSAEKPRYIETLPRRGYRFLANVSELAVSDRGLQRRARVVVLPFSNLGGDAAEEYFSDAVTDEITTALCRVAPERLAVIARTTAMHYKGSKKEVAKIGRELGVSYVVEGGVRRSGDKVEMNVQLIEAHDQTHVYAGKYEAEPPEIFKMVDRAAVDLADSIGITAGSRDARVGSSAGVLVRRRPTEDPAAYNEYVQARYAMGNVSPRNLAQAKRHLEEAVVRDPQFALAYDAMAEIDWYMGYFGFVSPRKAFSDGIAHCFRALEIDAERAETHALLGQFHKVIEYNWPEVHREMGIALQLDPNSPLVKLRYAVSELMPHGCIEEATTEIRHALELDPLSVLARTWLGVMLVLARKWDLALEQARLVLQLDSNAVWGHFVMGVAYRGKRRIEEAIAAHRRAVELSGGMAALVGWLGLALGLSGDFAEAGSLLDRLHENEAHGYVPPTSFAWIHLGLGETNTAFEWLDRAVDECDQLMMPIKSYEFFDPLRADPRFAALLRKMNLEG